MKSILLCFTIVSILSCSVDFIDDTEIDSNIVGRTLPNYIIPYQYPTGNIKSMTSGDLSTWTPGYTASTTASMFGTSSTIYNYSVPDTDRRCITIFQDANSDLKWVEYEDGDNSWSAPASISTAASFRLPSIEMNDGVVYEVHHNSDFVQGSYKNGSTWVTPYSLYYSTLSGLQLIPSDYSPTLEYHETAGVEYLVTGYCDDNFSGFGLPRVYWRYTNSYYTQTLSPSITTGLSSNDLNSSFTPVAVENNGDDKLYLFYTLSGTSEPDGLTIRYKIGSVAGNYNGAISGYGSEQSISGAYTDHKLDGFYEADTRRIIVVFRNYSTGEIDLAITDDYGTNWSFETGIDDVGGAPSIVNLE